MNECEASSAVRDAAKETHFSLPASRILNRELHDWEEEGDWERGRYDSERALKGCSF